MHGKYWDEIPLRSDEDHRHQDEISKNPGCARRKPEGLTIPSLAHKREEAQRYDKEEDRVRRIERQADKTRIHIVLGGF